MTMARMMRYSEAFKLKVVSELERGEVESVQTARRRYGIGGSSTVQRWLRRFGKAEALGKVAHVRTAEERDEIDRLRRENKQLREIVGDLTVKVRVEQAYFRVACDAAGIKDHAA